MRKSFFLIFSTLLLAGCGGGGGGGSSSSVNLISEWLGTDPNAASWTGTDPGGPVVIGGKTYDFTPGTPDAYGASYASLFDNPSRTYTYASSLEVFGGVASSAGCKTRQIGMAGCGPTIGAPNADVTAAWNNGWTGKGVNVLVFDNVYGLSENSDRLSPHAALVGSLVQRYAWASNIYGISYSNSYCNPIFNFDGSNAFIGTPTKIGVINASFGANVEAFMKDTGGSDDPGAWTTAQLLQARSYFAPYANNWNNVFTTGVSNSNVRVNDAVIAKAAGNYYRMDAQYDPYNYYMAHDANIGQRLLIVGALDATGSVTTKTDLAYYSNIAGTDLAIQNRFLLASGQLPFDKGTVSYDGVDVGAYTGTSFAAPRVAGYAAILRQKFPNLTAANTADILLQTARYDTLKCYPNCNKAIYGQGEASLSRAMSPVGALK